MDKALILSHLGHHPWGEYLVVLEETSSTNTLLKSMGQQGAPHGTVVIADRQSGGRGRMGRTFLSPGGTGIYFSCLIRPNVPPTQLMHLTCAVGSAMCDAVERVTDLRPGIKWINDLVVGSRKLGGILVELSLSPKSGNTDFAVLGIGINCTQQPEDFDPAIADMATSLVIATGKPVNREHLAAEMIRSLSEMDCRLLTDKDSIMAQYEKDCITIGKSIQVLRSDSVRPGTATGIDKDGCLIVQYEDGTVEHVSSGEVSIRGMYGYV